MHRGKKKIYIYRKRGLNRNNGIKHGISCDIIGDIGII